MKRSWLKRIRLDKRLTQYEVCKKAGINRAYYTQIETGARNPSVTTAKKIASVLGIDWTIFYGDDCGDLLQNKEGMANERTQTG